MPLTIVRQDITKLEVDAIVNAANANLQAGGGVCGAIFKAAGPGLQEACDKLAPIETGEAVVTPAFNLPAKWIIHAAGPVYREQDREGSAKKLRAAYTNALKRAVEQQCESVAFPLISSGIYGYPKEEALAVATSAIGDFLDKHDLQVTLAVFDKDAFVVSRRLLGEVESYIDEHYIKRQQTKRFMLPVERRALSASVPTHLMEPDLSLEDLVDQLDEPFSSLLLRLIDSRGKTDVEVYKRANLDRKLFSKIRSNKDYRPGKRTVLALAIGLELSADETKTLLARAGYALSPAVLFDVIVEYFITNKRFNVFEINQVLFNYDQPLLGG
ncbi:MAG: macro domain-containing protein [Clostridiaceae bacterium]|jgi:O-acetyl-ADP-ribose deacetylase (regulator of RNase III)|nr:macro domain-containing protein [Clostridiaceae bacterium]